MLPSHSIVLHVFSLGHPILQMLSGKVQDGKGTKNMIAPQGSNSKLILENSDLDIFAFQKYQKTSQCNGSHRRSQLIFTNNAHTTFTSLDIEELYFSFSKFIPIQLKLKKTNIFLILSLADLPMRELNNFLFRFSPKRTAFMCCLFQ